MIILKKQDLKITSEAHSFCNDTLRNILARSFNFVFVLITLKLSRMRVRGLHACGSDLRILQIITHASDL